MNNKNFTWMHIASVRIILITLAATLLLNAEAPAQNTGLDQTAMEIAQKMGVGWNLGNTMEGINWRTSKAPIDENYGTGTETHWQGTKTTREIIQYVKQQGFSSIRIPCNWRCGHITDATTCTIDPAWIDRVKEVVDYCVDEGLYVILNDHYDGGWLEQHITDTGNAKETNKQKLNILWTQIAEAFKDYDEHLLFAGLNEPNAENQSATNNLIEYEQVFIDAVRATGGNNTRRVLIVQGPSTDIDKTYSYFDITQLQDPTPDRLCVEIHFYYPWNFWGMTQDESWGNCFYYWGSGNHVSGSKHNATYGEENDMKKQAQKLKSKFVDKGVPVINGEFGVIWRAISGANESQEKHNASIKAYYKYMVETCLPNGIVPFAWDTNWCPAEPRTADQTPMTIIDRSHRSIYNPYMMDGIKEGLETAKVTLPTFQETVNVHTYDLQGRRVDPTNLQKGIYIRNGRKFIRR